MKQNSYRIFYKRISILLAIFFVFGLLLSPLSVRADVGTPLSGDVLNGVKVRFRPAGSFFPLSVNDDGRGIQNVVHLFYSGKSSQFQLQKADDDSYNIYFYEHYRNSSPRTEGDCRLDLELSKNPRETYFEEGLVIHVVPDNEKAVNKRWQLIPTGRGTYYIRNELTQQYWSLQDPAKTETYYNKLVQRETPMEWEIEIVSNDNEKLPELKQYDSINFDYNGNTITSLNWMGALPGTLKLSDISIPGTHDVGTCHMDNSHQDSMSDQRYYIDELLNAGVRHLDLRIGLDSNKNLMIFHSTCPCMNHQGKDLSLDETMDWVNRFLAANPSETIILQIKVDNGGSECTGRTFRALEQMARDTNTRIWAGDHVPTLDEVRGKIVIISRLDLKSLSGANAGVDFNMTKDGKTVAWALDCPNWRDSKDLATALTSMGSNYEVWTQDNWDRDSGSKERYIKAALLGNSADGTNSTLYRYNQAKLIGKDAWVLNYTSCYGEDGPFENAKAIHEWLYNHSDYSDPNRIVCADTFTGIMAFDFCDELLAAKIYKTNFHRRYITIHGITQDGTEPIEPLTLSIGESESTSKLLDETTLQIIKRHFNEDPYAVLASNSGNILSAESVTTQQAFNEKTAQFRQMAESGTLPEDDLYVHLQSPISEAEVNVEMPVCGTAVSASDPKVSALVDESALYNSRAFITKNSNSDAALEGTAEGGKEAPLLIYLTPKWGYRFATGCSIGTDTARIVRSEITADGLLKIRAAAMVLHADTHVDAVPATCTEDGEQDHYYCANCGAIYRIINESAQVEMDDSEILLPALGHAFSEWTVIKEATETADGEMKRTCSRCNTTETAVIPMLEHKHVLIHVEANEPQKCTEIGHIEYWICDGGENPCGSRFSDAEGKNRINMEDTVLTGKHDWGGVSYTEQYYGPDTLVKAVCVCKNNSNHRIEETVSAQVTSTPATCTESDFTQIDAVFEHELLGEYHNAVSITPALGHLWDEGKVTKEPTCSTVGERVFTCERCKETKTEEIAIDPNAHSTYTVEDPETDTATCTEPGTQTQNEYCSLCEKLISTRSISTEPLGHDWEEPVYTLANSFTEATAERTCKRCQAKETETVATVVRNGYVYTNPFTNPAFTEQRWEDKTSGGSGEYNLIDWTKGSNKEITIKLVQDLPDPDNISAFVGLLLDDQDVPATAYTYTRTTDKKGCDTLSITLSAQYLETLALGEHTMFAIYENNGFMRAYLRILEGTPAEEPAQPAVTPVPSKTQPAKSGTKSPKTGDESNAILWLVLMGAASGGIVFILRKWKASK